MYDLIIKNGTLIDFSQGIEEKKNIYIRKGNIAAIEPCGSVVPDAEKVIDAAGCIVSPGFIDAHTHLFYGGSGDLSTDADISCLPNCVTTGVDAGSTGISSFEAFYKHQIVNSIATIKALLHPCITGVQVPPEEENENPAFFQEERICELFREYPHTLKGLKIRMSKGTVRNFGMAPILKTQEIAEKIRAEGLQCGVYAHYSDLADGVTMETFLNSFRPGDIIYHFYHPAGSSIFNEDGSVMDCVLKARERGVLFDSSRGRINFSIPNVLKGAEQNFYPDIISTDLGRRTLYRKPNFSLLNSMSLFLNVGMGLSQILKAVTYTPANAFGILEEAGTLKIGRRADIAVIREIAMKKEYADCYGGSFWGDRLLLPMATIKAGRTVFQQIFMD